MKNIAHPSDKTIDQMLKNTALMYEIAANQRCNAVDVARAAGWTYERIMDATGYGYTAVRGLDPRLNEAAAA